MARGPPLPIAAYGVAHLSAGKCARLIRRGPGRCAWLAICPVATGILTWTVDQIGALGHHDAMRRNWDADDPDEASLAVARADHLIDLRRWDAAIETLRRVPVDSAAGPDVLAGLARALAGRRDHVAALHAIEMAIEMRPDDEWLFRILARSMRALGRFDEALAAASEAVRLAPAGCAPHLSRAEALLPLGRPDDAQTEVERGLAAEPTSEWALDLLCRIDWTRGNWSQAEARLRMAVGRNPDDPQPLLMLAAVLAQQGHTDESQSLRRRAARIDPSGAAARIVTRDMAENAARLLANADLGADAVGSLGSLSDELFRRGCLLLGAWVWGRYARGAIDAHGVPASRHALLAAADQVLTVPWDVSLTHVTPADAMPPAIGQALRDYLDAAELGGEWFARHEWGQRRLTIAHLWHEEQGPDRSGSLNRAFALVDEALGFWSEESHAGDRAEARRMRSGFLRDRHQEGDAIASLAEATEARAHARRGLDWSRVAVATIRMSWATLVDPTRSVTDRTADAIELGREAVAIPVIHGTRLMLHAERVLAFALRARYLCTWDVASLDESIAHWREVVALAVPPVEALNRAEALRWLGRLTADSPHGDHAENVDAGIRLLRDAQRCINRGMYGRQHAAQARELAALYRMRIAGNRRTNDHTALRLAVLAYDMRNAGSDPDFRFYAIELGRTYRESVIGDPADNLARALSIFLPEEEAQVARGMRSDSLLTIRHDIIRTRRLIGMTGDRDELDKAIALALMARTPDAKAGDPQEWTKVTAELARALAARGHGISGSDTREAIECYDAALSMFSREQVPWLWDEYVAEKVALETINAF
jgi:tetratricopeptide (TPR) repeat protein